MKTIHRYVLKEMMPTFVLCVSALTLLFFLNKLFLLLDLVLNKKVPFGDTLLLYVSLIPFLLSITVPMSMMVATLLALGRLASDMEVTALKSAGVHLRHLILPVMGFGLVMTAGMLYFNHKILPAAKFTFKRIHYQILKDQADVAIQERTFIDRFEGYQFYVDRKDDDGKFSDVTMLFRWSNNTSMQTALSKTGSLINEPSHLGVLFHMKDGVITWNNNHFKTYSRLYFDGFTVDLKLENQLSSLSDVKKDYEEMDMGELRQEIANSPDPSRKRNVDIELQGRLSLSFACLALPLFCAPLGLWARLRGFLGFGLGLIMIFIYYLMFVMGQILSERGSLSPEVGMWFADWIMVAAGLLVYYLVVAEHSAFRLVRPKGASR